MRYSSTLNAFADYLANQEEAIVSQFIAAMRCEPAIVAANELPKSELADNLPRLLDDLAAQLRRPASREPVQQATEKARQRGSRRWNQGYRLDELLKEIAVLRQVFLYQCNLYRSENPDFTGDDEARAERIVHGFLDQLMVDCASEYLAHRDSAKGLGSERENERV